MDSGSSSSGQTAAGSGSNSSAVQVCVYVQCCLQAIRVDVELAIAQQYYHVTQGVVPCTLMLFERTSARRRLARVSVRMLLVACSHRRTRVLPAVHSIVHLHVRLLS
jgi:hypothetical protein